MKTIDRIFIAVLVMIICISGIYAVKSFSKGREAINVVGEGQVEVKPDTISMNIRWATTGSETLSDQAREKEKTKLEQLLQPLNFSIKKTYTYFRDHWSCSSRATDIETPCRDIFITITSTGENIIKNWEEVLHLLEKKSIWSLTNADISVSNTREIVKEARKLALQDAKAQAEATANTLGVKLGRLLQTTEYGLREDEYGSDPDTYFYHQSFYNGESLKDATTLKITRKAYLTYDID